jgi:hypothetical protein
LPLVEVTSFHVTDRTALTTGLAMKVIRGKEGKERTRDGLEELERDTEILKEVLYCEREKKILGRKFNKTGKIRVT